MTNYSEASERLGVNVHRSLSLLQIALDNAGFTRESPGRYRHGTVRVSLTYGCAMGAFKLYTAKSGVLPATAFEGVAPLHWVASELKPEADTRQRERNAIWNLARAAEQILSELVDTP